ncbi:zinc ribbon domain-containing protein [uncultured Ruminococcus sp.]|uniref:zinc ribbon domain-containing protein n=1 Tax=uncultured Ruminococcus sp. TaxID=165186 RepID=UPI0025FB736C|nr:zinc ribbon domain-containing protein [uncultured Ruminococcus sp.]
MKCQHCGNELKESAKFCDGCGAPVEHQKTPVSAPQSAPMQPNFGSPQHPKKKIYKQWWFWVIIVVAFVVVFAIGISNEKNTDKKGKTQTAATVVETTAEEVTTEEPTTVEPTTEKPTEDPKKVEKEFKDSCDTIDFKTLSRNPDKYKGNNYKLTGEIIQVQESAWGDTVDLRINITKEEFEYIDDVMWTDTIFATVEIPDGEDKLLEDDVITFWGTCDGNYTYETVLGNNVSLPKIDIKYYELNN